MPRKFTNDLYTYFDSGIWTIGIRDHASFTFPTTLTAFNSLINGNEIEFYEKSYPQLRLMPTDTHPVYEDGVWKTTQFNEKISLDVQFPIVDSTDLTAVRSEIITSGTRYDIFMSKKAARGIDFQLYKTVCMSNVPTIVSLC